MIESSAGWNKQHERYAQAEWIGKPTIFAEWALQHFPTSGAVLDMGCGQGQDSRLFAEKGYDVVGIDFAREALRFAKEKTPDALRYKIEYRETDISKPLEFPDARFDVVYSHLATHYFDAATTQRIFDEAFRVLKPGGTLVLLVNSVTDAEIPKGTKIEDDFYQIGDMKKRFFSSESLAAFASKFEILVSDDKGETYKDRAIGNANLIRLVARKPA